MLHLVYDLGEHMADPAPSLLGLIGRLYDAAADPRGWPGFLDALAETLGGVAPGVYLTDLGTDANLFHAVSGLDPTWGTAYETHFKRCDPRRPHIRTLAAGSVFCGSALLPDAELVRSEFYNDFLRPQGFFHILGAVALKRPDAMGVVRVIRPRSARPFGERERAVLRTLVPHISRALRLHEQLLLADLRRAEAAEILDRLPVGVLLLDAAGCLVSANSVAEELLRSGTGLRAGRDGMRASLPGETARLRQLIDEALGNAPSDQSSDGIMSLTRPPPLRPLHVLVAPLRGGSLRQATRTAAAVVFVTDPERPAATSPEQLQRWLGLTPAEGALVAELLCGRRVDEAAVALHISTHTARTQLKRVLAKTGTGRQPELLRLVLGTPGALLRTP
jgi:DNA-binding CsgD family transcriptional regulator/PAS domain-containing protein